MKLRQTNKSDHRKINLSKLKGCRLAIIGYGSQGRAQALNLRDSSITPLIGLPARSRSRKIAREDGMTIVRPDVAVERSDLIAILAPDHKHKELFDTIFKSVIRKGQTFIFAHALSVNFGLVQQPKGVDFILVAPHGPGVRLRERFRQGHPMTAFIGRTEKSSPASLQIATEYATAIGCNRANLIKTSFADEAIGDIFGEQAVLCGGLSGLMKAGFDTLVKSGLSPENAYLECINQIDLIVDLIKRFGIGGMYDRISTTAAYGSLLAEDKIINSASKKAMKDMLKEISSGRFVESLMADYRKSFVNLKRLKKSRASKTLDRLARKFYREFEK